MLNITYKDRRTNIWVKERTKLIYIIYTERKMKWSWAGHINRLKDDRWTSRVTTWRPYDKKIRQGRPAKRWRDDLDKYWSDTIWQRTAQDRVIWRRHAKAFAHLLLLVLCRAAVTPHNRTLEVRPGRISKMLELDYDYDVKWMIRRG